MGAGWSGSQELQRLEAQRSCWESGGKEEKEDGRRGREGGKEATHSLNDEHGYRLQDECIGCKVTCRMCDMAV